MRLRMLLIRQNGNVKYEKIARFLIESDKTALMLFIRNGGPNTRIISSESLNGEDDIEKPLFGVKSIKLIHCPEPGSARAVFKINQTTPSLLPPLAEPPVESFHPPARRRRRDGRRRRSGWRGR